MRGAAAVMRDLEGLAAGIETEILREVARDDADARSVYALQKMDLLLQSLAEMGRLFSAAPHSLASQGGIEALTAQIPLEHLRSHFLSRPLARSAPAPDRGNAMITLFD